MDWYYWAGAAATVVWIYDWWRRRQLAPAGIEWLHLVVGGGYTCLLDNYAHTPALVERLLRQQAQLSLPSLLELNLTAAVLGYLTRDDWDTQARESNGWTPEHRATCIRLAGSYIAQPRWQALIEAGLDDSDDDVFAQAAYAAELFGRDCWPLHWQRLQRRPLDPRRWSAVLSVISSERLAPVLDFALQISPLPRISGNADEHTAPLVLSDAELVLELVLQTLVGFPGQGRLLALAGLGSPVIRTRHLALTVLRAWEPGARDTGISQHLHAARAVESHEPLRRHFDSLDPSGH